MEMVGGFTLSDAIQTMMLFIICDGYVAGSRLVMTLEPDGGQFKCR